MNEKKVHSPLVKKKGLTKIGHVAISDSAFKKHMTLSLSLSLISCDGVSLSLPVSFQQLMT